MLSINTNLSSLIAQNSLTTSTNKLNQAIERMTTGFKINHAKDNAANYSIATNLTTKIGAYMVAEDNCAMGLDMLATANGSLDQISDKLSRLRILAEQASNGTYGEQSLKAINAEANALVDEINRLYSTAEYNGMKIFETETAPAVATFAARTAASDTGFINSISQRNTSTMATLASVSDGATISSGTYSISTAEELEKLATMTNNGQVTGGEFVLANDIDLSSYSNWTPIGYDTSNPFQGIFDGNGHVINGLKSTQGGLFGVLYNARIKNLGVENAEALGGIIATQTYGGDDYIFETISYIQNCYTSGVVGDESTYNCAGGIIGGAVMYGCLILEDSWSSADVASSNSGLTGGLAGFAYAAAIQIDNCYSTGDIQGSGIVGTVAELNNSSHYSIQSKITNSFSTGTVTEYGVANTLNDPDAGNVANCYYNAELNPTISCLSNQGNLAANAVEGKTTSQLQTMLPTLYSYSAPAGGGTGGGTGGTGPTLGDGFITLQVGTSSDSNSQIGFEISFSVAGVDDLRLIGLDTMTDYLTQIDTMLSTVNAKQTEFGAVENRLESALDEISTQYENLVSTRSTIRDADIAEVSSEYIRQQILQQASATLMSTANQSPSIALQLI